MEKLLVQVYVLSKGTKKISMEMALRKGKITDIKLTVVILTIKSFMK